MIPVVDDFKEISVRQEDVEIVKSKIKMQLCIADGRLLKLGDVLLVSRHQQLTDTSTVYHTHLLAATSQLSLLPSET